MYTYLHPTISSTLWYLELMDCYISTMLFTAVYLWIQWTVLETRNVLLVIQKELEFIKVLHNYWSDTRFHWLQRNCNGLRTGTRPSRTERKFYGPGLSRRSYRSIDPKIYYIPTAADNRLRSAIKTKRWSVSKVDPSAYSYLPVEPKPPPLYQWCQNQIDGMWSEDQPSARLFVEINQVLASLWLLTAYRSLLFFGFVCRALPRKMYDLNHLLIRALTQRYLQIFCGSGSPRLKTKKAWVRMKTRKKHKESPRSKHWSRTLLVLATVCNIDEKAAQTSLNTSYFDSDTSMVICDNSANTHICNDKRMFTDYRDAVTTTHVATIGGRNSKPAGIGTVKWTWTDDAGNSHTHHLKDVLHFPTSPVNILSITELAKALNDDKRTGIDTKRMYSRFYWDSNKYQKTFKHSSSNLPEMAINEGISSFSWFTRACARKFNDHIGTACCCSTAHIEELAEKIDQDKTQQIFLDSIIQINEQLIFKQEGTTTLWHASYRRDSTRITS